MSDDTRRSAPWWKGAVIYQIYPRSFHDTNGDGVGDLEGIVAGVEHIASLGVDAIWLSPVFPSPMKDFGYDVSDYCGIDPLFGSLEDFDRLVETSHAHGLKVIIDQVWSHTSDQHAWFAESRADRRNPKADWYVWADAKLDGSPPSNWQSVFGGPAWEWDARRKQYYMHNFLVSQPDLNLHNPDVQDALMAVARFWLDRGVDGFRLDAINFAMHDPELRDNPPSDLPLEKVTRPFDMQRPIHTLSRPEVPAFLRRARALLDEYEGRFTVAEVVGPDPIETMKAYTEGEIHLNSAYNFDFLYASRLTTGRVRRSLERWQGEAGEGWPSWAFSNHDAPRAVSRWAASEDRDRASRFLILLLLSLRGNAFIYQGEELGLPQAHVPYEALQDPEAIANWPHTLGRDGARTPMPWRADAPHAGFSDAKPWLPVDPEHTALAVDRQQADPESCLQLTRGLVRLRQSSPALRLGDLTFLNAPEGLLAFNRELDGVCVTCVFNLSGETQDVPASLRPDGKVLATESGVACADTSPPHTLAPWTGFWAERSGKASPLA